MSRLASIGFIGPGYTAYSYLNAGYRIYTFDGDYEGSTHSIIDAATYYLDIDGNTLAWMGLPFSIETIAFIRG